MSRVRILNDINVISPIVEEYKKDTKPTIAGLCRRLKVCPNTVYRAMELDDEVSDKLLEAFTHLVEAHEGALWEKNPVAHIFYLKCIKRFGYQFKDNDPSDAPPTQPINIEFKVKE